MLWRELARSVCISNKWGAAIPYGPVNHGDGHRNHGYKKLKADPDAIHNVPEVLDWPEIQEFLTAINSSTSPIESVGCEKGFFSVNPPGDARVELGSYVEVIFTEAGLNEQPENSLLLATELLPAVKGCESWWAGVEFALARFRGIPGTVHPWGLFLRITNQGRTEKEARKFWGVTLKRLREGVKKLPAISGIVQRLLTTVPMTNELVLAAPAPELVSLSTRLPALFLADAQASERFFEFFAANFRNKNTRRAYYKAACRFSDWCEERGLFDLAWIRPIDVAAFVEELQRTHSKPTVKQHLAALRMLFDWLVVGHTLDVNPAHAVRGPKHVVKKGKTPVLDADEARVLLDSIDTSSLKGLRDRALIALMAYTFARITPATTMRVMGAPAGKRWQAA